MSASTATAQECQTDEDCGFGFQCKHETSSNTATTGGDWEVYCGNEICDGDEDSKSCPDDCEEYSYCVGAPCEVDSDCSEEYSCQQAGGEYSTTTSGNICGNAICEAGESADNCWSDCTTEQTCQPKQCESDEDCPAGYTCEELAGSAVASSSDGTTGTIHLVQTQCVNWGNGSGSGGNGSVGSSGVNGGVGGYGGADGDDSSSSDTTITSNTSTVGGGVTVGTVSSGNGSGGSYGSGGNGGAGDNGSGNSSDGNGSGTKGSSSGSGGSHGHGWPWPGHGCSLTALPTGGGSPLWALAALVGSAFWRRRRRHD